VAPNRLVTASNCLVFLFTDKELVFKVRRVQFPCQLRPNGNPMAVTWSSIVYWLTTNSTCNEECCSVTGGVTRHQVLHSSVTEWIDFRPMETVASFRIDPALRSPILPVVETSHVIVLVGVVLHECLDILPVDV
jgi:hypothetical protein